MPTAVERSQSPRGSHHSVDEAARLKRISSSDRLHLLRAWNEMDLHFKEGSVDYLWLFYTAFYSAKEANRKEQCYVAKLAIWKERSSFSHEYLVVTVKSVHDDVREHYLLFERTVGELNRERVREEKLDGEEKRRRRGRGEKRIVDAVNMPERLWEAHAFGGNATRPRDLSDEEEAGNDTWRMTVKSLISDVSESSSANLILADDRYQVLDKPFRNANDVHIASLILKKPYHDDDDEEATKITADASVQKLPTAQEAEQMEKIFLQEAERTKNLSSQEAAQTDRMSSLEAKQTEKSPSLKAEQTERLSSHEAERTEKIPSPVAPDNPEGNDQPLTHPKSDVSHPQIPSPQHRISALWTSPLIERQFSAESDSSLLLEQNITSNLDCDQSVLERASVSAPDITTARLSPHYFASQLPRGGLDDDWEVESSRGTIHFESGSERVSFRTSSPGSTGSFRSEFSAPPNQSSSLYGTPVLPYGLIEDSQNLSHEYLNPSLDPHEGTSHHRIITPVRRSRTSVDELSYAESEVEPEVKPSEVDSPHDNMDQGQRSLLLDSHESADVSRLPVLELKTLPDASQDPIEVSNLDALGVHVLREEEPPLSPLESEPPSPQQHPAVDDEISTVPTSTEYLPLGRISSHASSDSKKSTSSRVSRDSVRSLFSIHSDTIPPMPSRKYVFLFELVALAVRLHKCKSLYRLFTKNCYWFVGVMFHVIRNFCQIDVSVNDKDGKPEVMKPDDEVTIWVNSGRMGRFLHAIKIMKAPRLFTIQALKRKWQASNARFTAQLRVNFAETSPEQMSVIQHAVNREEVRQMRRAQREREIQHRLNELKKREEARAEEERQRHIEEIKEERKRYEEALKKKEEEAKKKEEEAKKREEEAKKRYEEEAKKKEEEAKKRYEEEAKKRYEEEARKREEEAKKRYEEEAKKKEEEAKKRYEEEARKREEEAREKERKKYEEERQALLEELMKYRESETKKAQE